LKIDLLTKAKSHKKFPLYSDLASPFSLVYNSYTYSNAKNSIHLLIFEKKNCEKDTSSFIDLISFHDWIVPGETHQTTS